MRWTRPWPAKWKRRWLSAGRGSAQSRQSGGAGRGACSPSSRRQRPSRSGRRHSAKPSAAPASIAAAAAQGRTDDKGRTPRPCLYPRPRPRRFAPRPGRRAPFSSASRAQYRARARTHTHITPATAPTKRHTRVIWLPPRCRPLGVHLRWADARSMPSGALLPLYLRQTPRSDRLIAHPRPLSRVPPSPKRGRRTAASAQAQTAEPYHPPLPLGSAPPWTWPVPGSPPPPPQPTAPSAPRRSRAPTASRSSTRSAAPRRAQAAGCTMGLAC